MNEWTQSTTYWPQVLLTIAALLPHFAGLLNRGSWGLKPSVGSWFSLPRTATRTPTNWLQLTRTVCGTGLYNCLTYTCFSWTKQLHRIQPVHGQGYILISLTRCTSFLINGWVKGQYVTMPQLRYFLLRNVCNLDSLDYSLNPEDCFFVIYDRNYWIYHLMQVLV